MSESGHAGPRLYWTFAVILSVITFVEWAIFKNHYMRSQHMIIVPALLTLSVVKFTMVCGWYMHLRYDHPMLWKIFAFSMFLAASVYLIVMLAL